MWNFDLSKRTQPLGNFRFFSLSFPYYLIDCINRLYLVRANDFERLSSFTSSFGVVGGGRRLYIVFLRRLRTPFFVVQLKLLSREEEEEGRERREHQEDEERRSVFQSRRRAFVVLARETKYFFLRDYNYRVHVTEKRGFVQGRRFGGRGNDDFVRGAT